MENPGNRVRYSIGTGRKGRPRPLPRVAGWRHRQPDRRLEISATLGTRSCWMLSIRVAAAAMACGFLLQAEIPATPRPAPEFIIKYADGNQLPLSAFKGKVVA